MTHTCPDCKKELATKRGRNSHRSQMHDWTRMIQLECELCDDEFERKRATTEDSDRDHFFCSTECQSEWQSKTRSGENSFEWEGGKDAHTCEWCDGTFVAHPSSEQRFCSRECSANWRSETIRGENHPNWNPDYDWWPYYGPNWSEVRERVLDRDDSCHVCGIQNVAYRQLVGRSLDVHHVVPFSEFDDSEEANDMANLVPLCASCHNLVERGR